MNRYRRLAVLPLESTVAQIVDHLGDPEKEFRVEVESGHHVHLTSLRLRTFARAAVRGKMECVGCGCRAEFFAVEKFHNASENSSPHLNLYGTKGGVEVLFTHDHILARALGGPDNLSNTQVMCSPCNNRKGKAEQREAKRRRAEKSGKTIVISTDQVVA